MARQCASEEERTTLLSRIRVIAYGNPQPQLTPELVTMIMQMDPRDMDSLAPETARDGLEIIRKLMGECAFVDKLGAAWSPVGAVPKVVIADVMMGNVTLPMKDKYDVLLFLWWFGSAASFTRGYAPLKHGGRADGYAAECEATFADEERRAGRSFGDIARDMWTRDTRVPGDIIKLAGLPPYFQWEDVPQVYWHPILYPCLVVGAEVVAAGDGFLMPTIEELEPEALEDLKDWVCPRPVLCLGPQLPPALLSEDTADAADVLAKLEVNYLASAADHANDDADGEGKNLRGPVDPAIAFLDKALVEHGPNSALYISFGSIFFPPETHVKILFETLLALEKPMPFVMALSVGSLPEEWIAPLVVSGRGIVVPWAPQQAMLSHPGLGWMLTHCGGGGTFESLSSGVPVIAWPFAADQPQHALWVSQVLDTGFDLLQVRTGAPGLPAMRGDLAAGGTQIAGTEAAVRDELAGVLLAAQGKEGARKRESAKRVRQVILNAVRKGGSAERALGELEFIL
ncbi:glycosyltransferase family 1 protein [Calocera cornea HHB12733]|uniref:Glycosyltransferase family 1 protein n=1 Tax=Calocera cornea HHB12733 TaxID=1353952 RepID=A0A165F5J4_9BASI|nr:glycosyltransferase family 1 protein [Calocera cornea HHB12733]